MKPVLTNLNTLNEMSGGDIGFVRLILTKLLHTIPEGFDSIVEADLKKDCQVIFRWSHKLKSSMGHIEAIELAELLQDLEYMAHQKIHSPKISLKVKKIKNHQLQLLAELEIHLESLGEGEI